MRAGAEHQAQPLGDRYNHDVFVWQVGNCMAWQQMHCGKSRQHADEGAIIAYQRHMCNPMRAVRRHLMQDVLPMHDAKLHLGPLGLQVLLQLLVPLLEGVGFGQ